jgi:hypothetical protein
MDEHKHHEDLIAGISAEYGELLATSSQGIYVYLDDVHKLCNENFASMLGYDSAQEWAAVEDNFPTAFVIDGSQELLVETYGRAMQDGAASKVDITWKTKTGKPVKTSVILAPISHQGHAFALHFVSEK